MRCMVLVMSERRTLLALLLLAVAVTLYIWVKNAAEPADKPKAPDKIEAEERVKAEPFPEPAPQPR